MYKVDWRPLELLASQALSGDKRAYADLLTQISHVLKPRFERSLPSAYVEDALQETLMAIHKSIHTLDLSKSLAAWVYAIARYKTQDQLRHIYKHAVVDELDEGALLGASQLNQVEASQLDVLLKSLNERESRIIVLLKVEEFSVNEIANELKMTPSNVKVTAFRAIRKLREALVEEDFYENR
ncbi:MAG: sigma-70 family RNA polymerase sigma factor [Bdellovibrionota bacterium]